MIVLIYFASYMILNRDMRFPTMWYVQLAKPQISLQSGQSLFKSLEYSMTVKLLTEQARLNLHLSKCDILGNHMSWLI